MLVITPRSRMALRPQSVGSCVILVCWYGSFSLKYGSGSTHG